MSVPRFIAAVLLALSAFLVVVVADVVTTDTQIDAPIQPVTVETEATVVDMNRRPSVSVPEPIAFFGLGSIALAIGGGLLIRNKRN